MKTQMFLAMLCVALIFTACKTSERISENRVSNEETFWQTETDSLIQRIADSVFVFVDRSDSMTHIIERTVHWREKVKVQKDTVVVCLRTDTLYTEKTVAEETQRSPPAGRYSLAVVIFMIALIAIVLLTIKKYFYHGN